MSRAFTPRAIDKLGHRIEEIANTRRQHPAARNQVPARQPSTGKGRHRLAGHGRQSSVHFCCDVQLALHRRQVGLES